MRFLLTIMIILPMLSIGQGNLVPNPSFEEHTNCPNSLGQLIFCPEWINPTGASPDYFNACSEPEILVMDTIPRMGVPKNRFGDQVAKEGQAYVGIYSTQFSNQKEVRDYIQVELTEPLYHRIPYAVSFYVSLAEDSRYGLSTLGAHLSIDAIGSSNLLALDAEPQILPNPLLPILDTIEWVLITDTFVSAEGGERYLTIGNFFSDVESDTTFFNPNPPSGHRYAYYYIDDVSVVALDSVPNNVDEIEQKDGNTFTLYPNPNNGQFTLAYDLKDLENGEVRVFDMVGKQVFSQTLNTEAKFIDMNLTQLNAGVYLISLEVNNEVRFAERLSILK